jgi:hypothetical protein
MWFPSISVAASSIGVPWVGARFPLTVTAAAGFPPSSTPPVFWFTVTAPSMPFPGQGSTPSPPSPMRTNPLLLLHEHRELVIALVAADAFEDEVSSLGSDFAHTFDALETLTGVEAEGRGFAGLDTPLTVRVTAGMVMSAALLSGWLCGARRPSRDRLVHEMTMYVLYGISARPTDGPQLAGPSAAKRRAPQTRRRSKAR